MNNIKYLLLLAPLIAMFSISVNSQPVAGPISIEEWCRLRYFNNMQPCLDGYYVNEYPVDIIWGSYGGRRDWYRSRFDGRRGGDDHRGRGNFEGRGGDHRGHGNFEAGNRGGRMGGTQHPAENEAGQRHGGKR